MSDAVRIHSGKSWSRLGVVVRKHKNPRSYVIKTDKGTFIRRNRRDLLKINNNSKMIEIYTSYPDIEKETEARIENNEEARIENDHIRAGEEEVINEENIVITRSGRQVNRPQYLNAYETN